MVATIELGVEELSVDFVKRLRNTFKNGRIEIKIYEEDTIDKILQNHGRGALLLSIVLFMK
jgi:hypothetical protein